VALARARMVLYNICYYNNVKANASNTWAFMVLPGHVRACFFCGEVCTYSRKEVSCEDVSDMLAEQTVLSSTNVFHSTMRNMLSQCQEAYTQSTAEQGEHVGRVVACTACYNWIMHRRQTLPFVTPVQILHWFFNTLSNTIPKKIDIRIISGVCHRLVRAEGNIQNYYYTLFGAHEQALIQEIAQCADTRTVEGIIARFFFESCKQSPIVLGCSISNFLRHNLRDDVFAMNVYRSGDAV
jgi:hypothetical protein